MTGSKEDALAVALRRLIDACEKDPEGVQDAIFWARGVLNISLRDLRKAARKGVLELRREILANARTSEPPTLDN